MTTNRFFVYEGKALIAAQSSFAGAMRYVRDETTLFCCAYPASDGLWNYGPVTLSADIRTAETGVFPSLDAALTAAQVAS